MSRRKFILLGCGRIGKRHAEHIGNYGELVGVCDIEEKKAIEFSKEYHAPHFVDLEEMLSNIKADIISICTPNGLHFEHTVASLLAGLHVICEKPMALTVDHCGQMINESLKVNRRLFIVKQNRFNPPIAAAKKALDDGKLGKLLTFQLNCFWNRNEEYYSNSWKGTKTLDGGSLFTQFSHFIDLLSWMIGEINSAKGYRGNYNHNDIVEFEDNGVAILEFKNGVVGTINYTTNSFEQNMEGSLTLFGTKGTVKIGGQYLNELEYQAIDNFKIAGLPEGNPPNNYGKYRGSMSNHGDVYKNVLEVLDGNQEIATNGFEGMKTVEIIAKIYSQSKWTELQ